MTVTVVYVGIKMGRKGKVILIEGKHQKRVKLMLELNLNDVLANGQEKGSIANETYMHSYT